MYYFKSKQLNYGLLAILFITLFLVSCEKENQFQESEYSRKFSETPQLSTDELTTLENDIPDITTIPKVNSIPEVSKEEIERLKSVELRAACINYNAPNYFPQIGLIYAFQAPVTWVWSYKYNDWIYLYNEDHLCGSWVYFATNKPICGETGMMADSDETDGKLYNWTCKNGNNNTSGWRTYRTVNCFGLNWVDPVPTSTLMTSEHGCRNLGDGFHAGIDFGGPVNGRPVQAVASGRVIRSNSSYGEVAIDHGSYITRYLHMQNRIGNNRNVTAGQQIGTVSGIGSGGTVTFAPHLHFDYYTTNQYSTNPDRDSQDPSVVVCHISNLGLRNVDTRSQGRLTIRQYCQSLGVNR